METLALARPDLHRQHAYVDGAWVEGPARLDVFNPATQAQIGTVPNLGTAEADAAVTAADRAQSSWRNVLAKERGRILRRWAQLMLDNGDDLAAILTQEQGKPLAEAKGEVTYAAAFLEWFAEEARRIEGAIIAPHQADRRIYAQKVPVGVVGAITPWNFPLAMITRKAGPALAAGCTMVLKPSELTPYSALALAALAEEAGVPAGVFNVVTGDAAPIGDVLTGDPRVRKFTFTGSTAVGKMLAARCMDTVKRVSLELGGNAPLIVFDDADIACAVEGAMIAKFRNTGQTCVCANRLYVQSKIYDSFATALTERVKAMRVGPQYTTDEADCGPLIDKNAVAKAAAHVGDCVARGGEVLIGGTMLDNAPNYFRPTVITQVPCDALICREETFGPVAGLVRFETEEEAIALANDTRAGLASYFFTRDYKRIHRVSDALEYGMIGVNTGIISTEVAPFGGVKESGLGREGSRHGIEDYLEIKMLCTAI